MSSDFHAHHAPLGAWFTFTCGAHGAGGGFGHESGAVPKQRLWIGWAESRAGGRINCLPFLQADQATGGEAAAAFTPEAARKNPKLRYRIVPPAEVTRRYRFASDRWETGPFAFSLLTPLRRAAEPGVASLAEERESWLPAIAGTLELDNRDSDQDLIAILFIDAGSSSTHELALGPGRAGWGSKGLWGLAVEAPGCWSNANFDVHSALDPAAHYRRLKSIAGICVPVKKGERVVAPLAFGCCHPGQVTHGVGLRYRHADLWNSLEDVLGDCLGRHARLVQQSAEQDAWLARQELNDDRRFLLAHATRSYAYSTQCLMQGSDPVWVVNEGEYGMTNTFDLTVDHQFYELTFHPWTLRNSLDLFADRYAYFDEVKDPETGRKRPGGISFTHDMGVFNVWTPPGRSSYEEANLDGCFSYMSAEQLCNWILCAAGYVGHTGDKAWLKRRAGTVRECLRSLLNRDHPDAAKRIGIVQCDGASCGKGAEITTYDSLDASLGQARNNLYLGVKCWASWLGLQTLLGLLGDAEGMSTACRAAEKAAATLAGKLDPALGWIPAVFEGGNRSAIIPAIEGLIYPRRWGLSEALAEVGPYGGLIKALQRHFAAVMKPGLCLFADGGWKLSSTSDNSWMSKIFICQQVAETEFSLWPSNDLQKRGDAAHVRWQVVGNAQRWCAVDQVVAGEGRGSKYYPRLVTAWLWVDGSQVPG